MKILMIGHFVPYPPKGGSLQRTFNILREISKENSVHLLALNMRALLGDRKSLDEARRALSEYCDRLEIFEAASEKSAILWKVMLLGNLFSKSPYSVWKFRSGQLRHEIADEMKKEKFDLAFFDTIDLAQYTDLVGDIPKVLNHHNIESSLLIRRGTSEKNPLSGFYLGHQGKKLKRYESIHSGKFDMNLVVSDNDGEILRSIAPDARFITIPNGTDTDYFTPASESKSNELVFAGGMNWYPNRDAMTFFCREVLPLIKRSFPEAIINIIGQSPPPEVVKIAREDGSVRVHGYVDDVREYIARSAVYVCPIRVGGGTRLKILDAFACGKALVSTSVGCEGIEVTPGENILIGDSPEEFAERVVMLLKDSDLRRKLEIRARELAVSRYSWHIIGETVRSVLKDVAG